MKLRWPKNGRHVSVALGSSLICGEYYGDLFSTVRSDNFDRAVLELELTCMRNGVYRYLFMCCVKENCYSFERWSIFLSISVGIYVSFPQLSSGISLLIIEVHIRIEMEVYRNQ